MTELKDVDVDKLWSQQHGATCHRANETTNKLKKVVES